MNANLDKLAAAINRRGPRVTGIRAFPSRRNPSKAVIRLILDADDNCGLVLNEKFWPEHVSCRRWKSRRANSRNKNVATHRYTNKTSYPSFSDYNKFDPLMEQVD